MAGLEHYLVLSGILFSVGLVGALVKRNVIAILMSIELMFNAVNLSFISFGRFVTPELLTGHIFVLFIITVAAGEVALGLAIVIAMFRNTESVDISSAASMKG
jgi:NAD(P)H-quinone oxidoreductase subunit 4L